MHLAVTSAPDPQQRRPGGDEGAERHRHDAAARRLPRAPTGCASWWCAPPRRRTARRSATRRSSPRTPSRGRCRAAGSPATSSTSRATCAASAAAGPTSPPPCCGSRRSSARTADTTLTRYFAQPFVPTVLGRDPRLQFVHVDDALEVLHRSVVEDHPGTFNVAGAGVLALSQAIRRAGRISVPVLERHAVRGRRAGPQRRRRADRPGPDRPLRARPGGRHHQAGRGVRLHAAHHRRRRSTTSSAATAAARSLTADRLAAAERAILDGIRRVRAAATQEPGARHRA